MFKCRITFKQVWSKTKRLLFNKSVGSNSDLYNIYLLLENRYDFGGVYNQKLSTYKCYQKSCTLHDKKISSLSPWNFDYLLVNK